MNKCCEEEQSTEPKAGGAAGGPMAMGMGMGMGMAKKMMEQMGQGEGKPPMEKMPMEKMMAMCAEMLGAIRQTSALAVFATPELQHAFAEWLTALDDAALAQLAQGEKDVATLAGDLKLSEASTNYILARLAASGKITLAAKLR